jgi:hypothetical protein
MKTRYFFLMFIMSVIITSAYAQGLTKKELRAEQNAAIQVQTEELIYSKDFVFIAKFASPSGAGQINLLSNPNFMRFNADMMESYMPFFGTAYAGIGYSGDTGIKFKARPDLFKIEKNKKSYEINAEVKSENDFYRISLYVTFQGSASLTVTSNHRSSISYKGEIKAP